MPFHGNALGTLLDRAGLLPKNTRLVTIEIPANGVLVMHCEVFIDGPMLEAIAQAMLTLKDTTDGDRPHKL